MSDTDTRRAQQPHKVGEVDTSQPSFPGAPAPDGRDRLAQAALRRKIQRRVVQRSPAASTPAAHTDIKLDAGQTGGQVDSPDPNQPKPPYQSAQSDEKDSPYSHGHRQVAGAVPLTFGGMAGADERKDQPTTVRVVLERFEEIHSAFLTGGVSVLGKPEAATLKEKDHLEVYCWGTNMSANPNERDAKSHQKSKAAAGRNQKAQIGFVPDPALGNFLTHISITQAPGVNSETAVPIPKGYEHPLGGAIFGMTINPGAQGGFVLKGEVSKTPDHKPMHASFTQAVHQAGDKKDGQIALGEDQNDHDYGKLHEQGSFYGDLHGEYALKAGQEVAIAAPGSTAYHKTLDRAGHVNERAAAYWVPIQIAVQPDAGLKGIIFEAPDSVDSPATGAGEGDIDVQVPGLMDRQNLCRVAKGAEAAEAKHDKRDAHRPGYSKFTLKTKEIPAAMRNGPINVTVLFRGSCATMIYMKGY